MSLLHPTLQFADRFWHRVELCGRVAFRSGFVLHYCVMVCGRLYAALGTVTTTAADTTTTAHDPPSTITHISNPTTLPISVGTDTGPATTAEDGPSISVTDAPDGNIPSDADADATPAEKLAVSVLSLSVCCPYQCAAFILPSILLVYMDSAVPVSFEQALVLSIAASQARPAAGASSGCWW
jgi:hypothetical protein